MNITPEYLCRGDKFCLFIYSKDFQIIRGIILFVLLLLLIGIIGFIVKLYRKKLQDQNIQQSKSIDDISVEVVNKRGVTRGISNLIFTIIIWVIANFLYSLGPWTSSFLSLDMVIIFLFPILASILEIFFSLRINKNSKVSKIILPICWAVSVAFYVVFVPIIIFTVI